MSELAIRRVVVACDAVCDLGPAIETATRLAAHWHASLHGVFLEDPGLRLAAGLPFVQQVTLSPAGPESFELAEIEEQFRGIARRAERTLAEAAARFGLDWSFSLEPQTPSETGLGGRRPISWSCRPRRGPSPASSVCPRAGQSCPIRRGILCSCCTASGLWVAASFCCSIRPRERRRKASPPQPRWRRSTGGR